MSRLSRIYAQTFSFFVAVMVLRRGLLYANASHNLVDAHLNTRVY